MNRLFSLVFVSALIFVVPLFSESLDQEKLDRLVVSLSLSRHPGDVDLKKLATAIDPNPVPYLKEIIENSPVRVYVKVNAVNALAEFESSEAKAGLEKQLSGSNQHRLVRQSVIKSYINKYYGVDPNTTSTKVRALIKEREFLDFAERSIEISKGKNFPNGKSKDGIKKMEISEEQRNQRKLLK
ncbi:hypothetical protein [Leptospira harrisiae]|uniref:HEAT repeat domain-containing protein n=1 Tax=Leptospira harrisiae TaxID=2023189 RepID=A0A2N0AI55_9LEPT|nr:hypothetical protein [Leptospira harrisiae]PJZ83986.1 hypothetical protein CH364_14635 [Leptospira harrisiae]PKA07556.1 hypothetical protein CH366_14310 [Leptospira harrisiae]